MAKNKAVERILTLHVQINDFFFQKREDFYLAIWNRMFSDVTCLLSLQKKLGSDNLKVEEEYLL